MKFTAQFQKYPDFMETYMKPTIGSPPLYLAKSATGPTPVIDPEEPIHSVLATLERCHAVLTRNGDPDAALLLSMTILQIRMKLNRIADSELKDMCDAIVDNQPAKSGNRKSVQNQRQIRRGVAMLKLVK